jgi:hypothetical protein
MCIRDSFHTDRVVTMVAGDGKIIGKDIGNPCIPILNPVSTCDFINPPEFTAHLQVMLVFARHEAGLAP